MRGMTMKGVCKRQGRCRTIECYGAFKLPHPTKCVLRGQRAAVKGVPRKK